MKHRKLAGRTRVCGEAVPPVMLQSSPCSPDKGPAASMVGSGKRCGQGLQPPPCSRRPLMDDAFSTHQGSCGSPRVKGEG